MSALVTSWIIRLLHKRLLFCKTNIVFKTSNRFSNYLSFKDIVPETLHSYQIYDFKCQSCDALNTSKTFRCMKFLVSKHQACHVEEIIIWKELCKHPWEIIVWITTTQWLGRSLKYWEGSLIIRFWRSWRIFILKEDFHLNIYSWTLFLF